MNNFLLSTMNWSIEKMNLSFATTDEMVRCCSFPEAVPLPIWLQGEAVPRLAAIVEVALTVPSTNAVRLQ